MDKVVAYAVAAAVLGLLLMLVCGPAYGVSLALVRVSDERSRLSFGALAAVGMLFLFGGVIIALSRLS